jgi:hypothetical protein
MQASTLVSVEECGPWMQEGKPQEAGKVMSNFAGQINLRLILNEL